MKIAHILPRYRHCNWQVDPNTTYESFDYLVWHESMQEKYGARHQILPFFYDLVMIDRGKKALNEELLQFISKERPDFVLFNVGEFELTKDTIRKITGSGAVTLYWCSDDSWRFDSVSKKMAPYFSWVASHPLSVIEKYKAMGCRTIFVHEGVRESLYRPVGESEKNIDVSFVGTLNPERAKTVAALRKAGLSVLVRGKGWPGGEVPLSEMVALTARSKISLILNPPSFYFGLKPLVRLLFKRPEFGSSWRRLRIEPDFWNFGDNLREWFSKLKRQVKARHFETLACRTLGMTLYAEDLEKYYEIGKEIIVYKDMPDLIEKIRYYLANPMEAERVARAGYERTIRDHAVAKRLEQIFNTIGIN